MYILILVIPFLALNLFFYCLSAYQSEKKGNEPDPDVLRKKKLAAIVSGVVAGVLLAVLVTLIALVFLSIAYM